VRFAKTEPGAPPLAPALSRRLDEIVSRFRGLPRRGTLWIATVVLAVAASAFVVSTIDRAGAIRAAYGDRRSVLVAIIDISPGTIVDESNTAMREWPVGFLPEGALSTASGRTAVERLGRGEVVVENRLSQGDGVGAEALIPAGGRALAIPKGPTSPDVSVGDRVDAFAPPDSSRSAASAISSPELQLAARRVARSARVIAVGSQSFTIAVTAREAPFVAQALLDTTVALVLIAPG
jgi:Flp pilus assembly protein CpaB